MVSFCTFPGLTQRGQCNSCVHVEFWKQFESLQLVSHPGTLNNCTASYWIAFIKHYDCMCVFLPRWTYQEFFSRYRVLMKQKDVLTDKKMTCKNVLEKLVQVLCRKNTVSFFETPPKAVITLYEQYSVQHLLHNKTTVFLYSFLLYFI